jgi:hypothetical protein
MAAGAARPIVVRRTFRDRPLPCSRAGIVQFCTDDRVRKCHIFVMSNNSAFFWYQASECGRRAKDATEPRRSYYEKEAGSWSQKAQKADADEAYRKAVGYSDSLFLARQGSAMNDKKPTYRVEIKNSGTLPNEAYAWKIYRNRDVLPILRSQQLFSSRMAGLADANRSRLQLINADTLGWPPQPN